MIINMVGGGGGTGATLTVNSTGAGTVTVSNAELGKSYSKALTMGGDATFKGLASGTWTVTLSDGSQTTTQSVTIVADYSVNVAYFAAYINITYPAGSMCTATDGVSTFTAPDTSGTWALTVPNVGTWTVSATNGLVSAENSVNITHDGQRESVELSYALSMYDAGYTFTKEIDGSEMAVASGWLAFKATWTGAQSSYGYGISTTTVNVSNFTTMTVRYKVTGGNSSMGTIYAQFGINKEANKHINNAKQKSVAINANGTFTATLDITSYTGNMYVYCGIHDNEGNYTVTFTDIVFS